MYLASSDAPNVICITYLTGQLLLSFLAVSFIILMLADMMVVESVFNIMLTPSLNSKPVYLTIPSRCR
jgi:hypothetical protein